MRLWLVLVLLPWWAYAQERCATDHIDLNQKRLESHAVFSSWLNQKIEEKKSSRSMFGWRRAQTVYTVPVVFHIIHNGEAIGNGLNLSEDRIRDQINILNEDFRRDNPNQNTTPAEYSGVWADTEIEFVLAKQDPEGVSSNGITRTEGPQDSYSNNDGPLMTSVIMWPPEDYLNIYITDLEDVLGFAVFPFSDVGGLDNLYENIGEHDGVFVDYEYFGYNDDPELEFESFGRTATHEVGHYLGLLHTFHGTCSDGGDYCADTPVQGNSSIGKCTEPGLNSCDEETRPMIENYMDYTDDACMSLFTQDQKMRMRTVLENSPRRVSLLSSPAKENPTIVANDLGIREIKAPLRSNCSGDFIPSIEVRNYGSNTINSYQIRLTINGNLIADESFTHSLAPLASVTASFSSPQSIVTDSAFTVSFEIIQVNGTTDGKASNNKAEVIINPTETQIAPYTLNFEASDYIITETEIQNTSQWNVQTAPNYEALNRAAVFPCYNNNTNYGVKDMLLTFPLDLSSLTSAQLSFLYSYSGRSSDEFGDGLIVGISTDCGASFHYDDYIFERAGNDLITTTKTEFEYTPASPIDWEQVNINITPYLGMGELQIAFIGVNGGGNNIYIDDIEVTSANLPAYDIGLRRLTDASIYTCRDDLTPTLNIRNYGFEPLNHVQLKVTTNGSEVIDDYNINLQSGQSTDIDFEFLNLPQGENHIEFEVLQINNQPDSFPSNNLLVYHVNIESSEDAMPAKETFDLNSLQWGIVEINNQPIFEVISTSRYNNVLKTNSFGSGTLGSETYLVSPTLSTENLETASVRFKMSYASRDNYIDNLKVLLSNNCGKTYSFESFNENLNDLTSRVSPDAWVPETENDWQYVQVDISKYLVWPELRVALVFTNGQGNHLYLDDVEVLASNDTTQIPFENRFTFYPNPVDDHFYMTFNLPQKQNVYFQLLDMSGKLVIEKTFENTLNQRYEVITPREKGFYLIVIKSKDVNRVERLYIR